MPSFVPRHSSFVIVLTFILLGSLYALTTPLFEASDELWHYPMAQHLSRTFALPVQDPNNVGAWRQEASQPPLYYYLMGWATSWIDTSDIDQVRWLNPHVDNGVITPDGNINLAIHTTRENFPYGGTALAVRLIRLLSVLMGAGTIYFTYLLAKEFFDDEPSRLFAAAFAAFTPMFVFISGAVNNDNLATLLSAVLLFLLVRSSGFNPRPLTTRISLLLGILLALAALTKQSALGSFGLTGLTLIAISLQQSAISKQQSAISQIIRHSSFVIRHSLFAFLPSLFIASWWYVRNIILYGDLLGWSAFIAVLGKRAAPANLLQLWGERISLANSFWGLFGGVNVPMSDWIYFILNAIAVIALIGCLYFFIVHCSLFIRRTYPFTSSPLSLLSHYFPYLLLLLQLLLITLGWLQWATVTWSSQGRLFFSAMSAVAIMITLGLRTLLPARARATVFASIGLFMFTITTASPFVFIAPKYVDPPQLTKDQLAGIPHPLNSDFGSLTFPPEMRLLGYDVDRSSVKPNESIRLTLYWQSLTQMDRDWSVFVHVVDENEIVIAQRDTYPGLGLMPTRKWSVGRTLADTYVIILPATVYAPSKARIEIGLYDYATGERLLVNGRDVLTLSSLDIAPNENQLAVNFDDKVELVGYKLDQRALKPNEELTLTLYWRGLNAKADYTIFAQVRGANDSLWAQLDSQPQPLTSAWSRDQVVTDVRLLKLKPGTPAGVYDVEVGLYDANIDRLQIVLPDGRRVENSLKLSKIRVLP